MISLRKYALGLAFLLAITAGSTARAQTGEGAIYGVTNLDVAPGATNQAITVLKQYRDVEICYAIDRTFAGLGPCCGTGRDREQEGQTQCVFAK